MTRVDVGAAIAASFAFIATAWRGAWGMLVLAVVATAAFQALGVVWASWIAVALNLVAFTLINVAVTGALFRLTLEKRHPGDSRYAARAAGLFWGGVETRVLVASLIAGAIFAALGALLAGGCAGVFAATGQAADPTWAQDFATTQDIWEKVFASTYMLFSPAGLALSAVLTLGLLMLFWLGSRLMLYSLTSADTGSFGLGRAWAASRGATGAIWITWIAISLVTAAVSQAASAAVGAAVGATAAGAGLTGALWGGVAGQAVAAALNTPLFVGLQLFVYQRTTPPGAT